MMKNCKNELSKRENWETGCSHGTQVRCQEEDQHIRQNHQRRQHIWWQCTSQQYIPEQRKLTAMNPIIVLTRYDMVSANGTSSEPRYYKKCDGILTHSGFRKYSWFGWPSPNQPVPQYTDPVPPSNNRDKYRGNLRHLWCDIFLKRRCPKGSESEEYPEYAEYAHQGSSLTRATCHFLCNQLMLVYPRFTT